MASVLLVGTQRWITEQYTPSVIGFRRNNVSSDEAARNRIPALVEVKEPENPARPSGGRTFAE